MDPTKIDEARKAGYSSKEIADYLAASNPKIAEARNAGYSDDEILSHLAPPPSLGRRALDAVGEAADTTWKGLNTGVNYTGTQTVKAASNLLGIPKAVGEAVNWASEKTGLPRIAFGPPALLAYQAKALPSGEQLSRMFFDATGAPEVDSGNKTIDAGVQGMLSVPLTGGTSLPALAAGGLGGAGSEIAGQVTKGTPWEIPARVIGGVVGAAAGAGGVIGAQKAGRSAKALVEPFTTAGRDKIVGRVLNEQATEPAAAIPRLETYSPPVPGFRLDAGRASMDPGLMAVADVVPDSVKGATKQANNALLTRTLDESMAGLPPASQSGTTIQNTLGQRVRDLKEARKAATDPLYAAARQSDTPVNPWPLMTHTADAVKANKGEPAAVMQKARDLLFTAPGKPDRTAAGAMATRQAVNDMLDNPSLGNHSRLLLMTMRDKIDDVLATVPEEAAARAKFAQMSKPLEPFDAKLGNKAVARIVERDQFGKGYMMPPEKVTGDLSAPTVQKIMMAAGGDKQVKDAIASAFIEDFKKTATSSTARDAAGNPDLLASGAAKWLQAHKGAAANVLTPDQIKALETISEALTQQAQQVPGRVNSATYSRMATDNLLSAALTPNLSNAPWMSIVRKALGLAYDDANTVTKDLLFEVIQDPKAAASLMKKATAGNAKLAEPVLISIARGTAATSPAQRERQ